MTYLTAFLFALILLVMIFVWSLIEIYLDVRKADEFDSEYLDS